jgi:fumarylacetoacetate (FAA) hydrolase
MAVAGRIGVHSHGELIVVVDRVPMGTSAAEVLSHITLIMLANDASLRARAMVEMKHGFGFHELIAHAAYSRNLSAATIIGSGTVSNADDRSAGSACIAERRAIELADQGKAVTEYMRFGDCVRIEMLDAEGSSVCGAARSTAHRARAGALPE